MKVRLHFVWKLEIGAWSQVSYYAIPCVSTFGAAHNQHKFFKIKAQAFGLG